MKSPLLNACNPNCKIGYYWMVTGECSYNEASGLCKFTCKPVECDYNERDDSCSELCKKPLNVMKSKETKQTRMEMFT